MSADNWTHCPRCLSQAKRAKDEERRAILVLYGTIPVEEFDAKREAFQDLNIDEYVTFREDYEFYDADTGEVRASYRGACTSCGLNVELTASKRFWTPEDEA